jgi:hypothetical protein
MTEPSTTQALGSTTVVFGWVEEARVQEVLHASDGFQVLLAITLAGLGGSASAEIALGAGALHPIAIYLIPCALLASSAVAGTMMVREFRRYRRVRSQLMAATAKVPVPVLLVTPGSPSFTVGGYGHAGSGPIVQNLVPEHPGAAQVVQTAVAAQQAEAPGA